MPEKLFKTTILLLFLQRSFLVQAQNVKVLTNQVGYENTKAKRAMIMADRQVAIPTFQLINTTIGNVAYSGKPVFSVPVNKWKNWLFWTIDFTPFTTEGTYQLQGSVPGKLVSSYPFTIGKNVLEQFTLSDVIYYVKGQRSSGLLDKADRKSVLAGKTGDTLDVHGGWYDASGDYGKHLSHLTFSSATLRSAAIELYGVGGGNIPKEVMQKVLTEILPQLFDLVVSGKLKIETESVVLKDVERAWKQGEPNGKNS